MAEQLAAYLEGKRTLAEIVSWAHDAFNEGEFDEPDLEVIRDVVARLGLADVAAFGLTWEDAVGGCWLALAIVQAYASSPPRPDRADAVTNPEPLIRCWPEKDDQEAGSRSLVLTLFLISVVLLLIIQGYPRHLSV